MKTAFFVICAGLTVAASAVAGSNDINERVEHWLSYSAEFNPSALSVDERNQVVGELRVAASSTSEVGHQKIAKILLARLGDEATISEAMQDLRGREADWNKFEDAYRVLSQSRQPSVIPMLISDLQDTSKLFGRGGERPIGPPHDVAAWLIASIIETSPQFPQTVRTSLQFIRGAGMERFRAALLQWCLQNKEVIERGDYVAVKPLQPMPAGESSATSPSPAVSQAKPSVSPPAKQAALSAAAATSQPAVESRLDWKLVVAAACVLLGLAGLVLLRKRTRG